MTSSSNGGQIRRTNLRGSGDNGLNPTYRWIEKQLMTAQQAALRPEGGGFSPPRVSRVFALRLRRPPPDGPLSPRDGDAAEWPADARW
jgi:hypothetical protein